MKLIEKKRVGSKIYKIHDKPTTPYQRVLDNTFILDEAKADLVKKYEALDPFVLKRNVDTLSKKIPPLARVSFADWKNERLLLAH
jgi:hypothetical protein